MDKILNFPGIDEIISRESLEEKLQSGKKLRIKFGADPSRPDIHLGHTIALRLLKRFQDAGHTVIFLIGDYTARIGDPSGRNKTRPILSEAEIKQNAKTYVQQVGKILNTRKIELRFNGQWYKNLKFAEFLKLSSMFTVSQIIERDDFAKRLKENQEVGLQELMYPLMQAYDSVVLHSDVEIGGTDQRFNFLAARELQKKVGQEPQNIITVKLLVGTDGKEKMSKSLDNYISVMDKPTEMFGKLMSIPDEQIINYFELCTDVDKDHVKQYQDQLKEGFNPRDLKFKLATEITSIYSGESVAEAAGVNFNKVHQKKELPEEIEEVALSGEFALVNLISQLKLSESNNESRRLISQGGVKIDGAVISDPQTRIKLHSGMVLQAGKRRFIKIK